MDELRNLAKWWSALGVLERRVQERMKKKRMK